MPLKGLEKSVIGFFIAVVLTFSFNGSSTSLISQFPFQFSNHSLTFCESNIPDIFPGPIKSAILALFNNPITNTSLTDIVIPTGLDKQRSISERGKTSSRTGLTWYSYSFEHASDFCQPPDPSSPLCANYQTNYSIGIQKPDSNLFPAPDLHEQLESPPGTQEGFLPFFTPPTVTDSTIEAIIAQVDQDTLVNYVGDLSGAWPVEVGGEIFTIRSRYSFSEQIHLASEYLSHFYQDLGLTVTFHDFDFKGVTLSNVVAEIPGSIFPEQVYIISAHYDSLPAGEISPGADDNASGVAGVMMAAKILNQYDFAYTLRFIHFAAEEQDLAGSMDYASQSHCDLEEIMAVLNLDMIAWTTPGTSPTMNLHANRQVVGSVELAEYYAEVINLYELDLEPGIIKNGTDRSDHAAFWKYNIPAILAIEDFYSDFNPYYHTRQDKLEKFKDLDYFTNMVKAAVATLAHMGHLVDNGWGDVTGFIRDSETGLQLAGASISFYNPEWDYVQQATTGDNGYFQISLVAGAHDLIVNAPGYATEYYLDINIGKGQIHLMNIRLDHVSSVTTFFPLLLSKPQEIPAVCR